MSCIDAVLEFPDRDLRVLLEVDETQHEGYPVGCELSRMMDSTACIRMGGDTRNLLWLRFNPDAYQVDGVSERTPKVDRYKHLEHVLRTYTPTRAMAVMYLYYSTEDGVPCVMQDPEYFPSFKQFVV